MRKNFNAELEYKKIEEAIKKFEPKLTKAHQKGQIKKESKLRASFREIYDKYFRYCADNMGAGTSGGLEFNCDKKGAVKIIAKPVFKMEFVTGAEFVKMLEEAKLKRTNEQQVVSDKNITISKEKIERTLG